MEEEEKKKKKRNESLNWQHYFSHRQIKEKSFEILRVADFNLIQYFSNSY